MVNVNAYETHCRYLNFLDVASHSTNEIMDHKVVCYNNLVYWVCPNPENTNLVKEMERQYNFGLFVEKRIFSLDTLHYYNLGCSP